MGSQLSPLPQPALPPTRPASIPYSLLPRLGLGVWTSNKLLLQTWAKEPEAAPRPPVREPLCEAAGRRVSDGMSCNSHGRAAGPWRLGSESGIPLLPPLFPDTSHISGPALTLWPWLAPLGSPRPIPSCD